MQSAGHDGSGNLGTDHKVTTPFAHSALRRTECECAAPAAVDLPGTASDPPPCNRPRDPAALCSWTASGLRVFVNSCTVMPHGCFVDDCEKVLFGLYCSLMLTALAVIHGEKTAQGTRGQKEEWTTHSAELATESLLERKHIFIQNNHTIA